MKTVLGIDLGTQSLKVVFYDYERKCIAVTASSPLEVKRDQKGKAEQQAEWWLGALQNALAQVPASVRSSAQAIGVSGQQHGFVPLDAQGNVLAPVKLWCDTATQQEVREITERCGGSDNAIALTGNPVLAGYTSPKIRWLRNQHPALYEKLAHILLPHDYLNYVLTGEYAMEYGDASGTGLLDVRKRAWSEAMLKAVDDERDLAACLPKLHHERDIIGGVSKLAADKYGLPIGIPVSTGGGDNMMGAIGTGNVKAGELTISLGTSGTLYAYSDTPVIDPHGNIAAFCSSSGGWLPLLCTLNCTSATELMRKPLGISLDEFDALAASVPAGCDGLITLPFFSGERTPNLPHAKGCILGLDAHNSSKAHLLRSTLEAVSFSLKFGLDELNRLGLQAREITLTGGGGNSKVWRQLIADLFQLPVRVPDGEEGASLGAALQALWVLQLQDNPRLTLAELCAEHVAMSAGKRAEPDARMAAIYEASYADYRRALKQIVPLFP
ncbi:MAG TPA: xylulokinase [Candidatus Acidoferrum sp.]|nr:xylulokinase [Candidatus Acidoferrum sp.]